MGTVKLTKITTPSGTVTVEGDLTVTGSLNARVTDFVVSSNSTTLGDASSDTLTINASTVAIPNNLNFDSNTLFIDASTNRVGIGTSSPSSNLELESSSGDLVLEMDNNAANSPNFKIQNLAGSSRVDFLVNGLDGGNPASLVDTTLSMKAQKVGIMQTNPAYTLDVTGNARFTSALLASGGITSTAASNTFGATSFNDADITNVGDIALDSISSDAGTSISVTLGTDSGDDFIVATSKLVVEGDTGRVGIGTATPDSNLEIESSSGDQIFEMDNNATNSANFQIQNGAGNNRVDLVMNALSANTTLTLKGQKVGVMQTNPSYTLDVTGDGNFTGDLTVAGGDITISGTTPKLTIGDAGEEDTMLVFDGAAQDFHVALDDSADDLVIGVGTAAGTTTAIAINELAQVQVVDAFAANVAGTFGTFADGDATPSVATGNLWKNHASPQTITMFDDGIAGQTITVLSTAAITYDVTSTNLKGGSTDIVTADGDLTTWTFDGTNWYLQQFMDASIDMGAAPGDITGVTAGVGLSGGGSSGDVTLTLDLSELSDVTPANGDKLATLDSDGSTEQLTTVADLATLFAGTGLTATNSVIAVNAAQAITSLSGDLAIAGDLTVTGGDVVYGNAQDATLGVTATAHNTAGKPLTISAGPTTAGTTNNIAGGSLTLAAGQGKGSGAGGDIVFKTANAGSSGSSLNSLATALTISDDLSSTFTGNVVVGSDGSGHDVTFHSATSGDSFAWDASAEKLTITGTDGQTALDVADGNATFADDVTVNGGATFASNATFNGAATFNSGISAGDGNITNVGDISLDSISSDGSLVTVNAPCEIANGSTAGATALVLDNDDADQIALSIEAANTTANVIDVSATSLTTGKVLHIDVGNAATTNQSTAVAHFDIDKTGIAASGQAVAITGIDLDLNDAATNVGQAALTGIDLDIVFADAGGTTNGIGLDVSVTGADNNYAAIFSAGQVGIGNSLPSNAPQGLLEVEAAASWGNTCLLVDNNSTAQIALHVDAANINQHAVVIDADALTTKSALYIEDDSSSTDTRNTVDIVQNNAAATAATALKIQSDSNGGVAALHIDRNAAGTVAVDAVTGILIDLDQTGEIAGGATGVVVGVDTNLETNVAGDGTLNAFGHRIVMTGDTDGTHSHTGLSINLGQADTNTHIELLSSADTGDKCTISVAAAGATTIATIDDDGAGAHLTLDPDGDIVLDAGTGIWKFTDSGTEVLRVTEDNSGDATVKIATDAKDLEFHNYDGYLTAAVYDNSGAPGFMHKKRVFSHSGGDLDLSNIDTALTYSGGIIAYAIGAAADDITLPSASSAAEARQLVGWHVRIIIAGRAGSNAASIIRADTSNDTIVGNICAAAEDAAAQAGVVSSNVATLNDAAASVIGDYVDIVCYAAATSGNFNTAYMVTGVVST